VSKTEDKKAAPRNAATNRRAKFDYEIVEKFEAGIELSGGEVKSLRDGGAALVDSYAMERKGQLFLVGVHIKPYDKVGYDRPDPYRDRRLLMHRKQIDKIVGTVSVKGMTIIPMRIYFNERGWAKVEIGLAKAKKQYDKRDTIKKRDEERELARDYKTR